MPISDKAILLTADLLRRRSDVKLLLGDKYAESVAPYRQVIRGIVKSSGKSIPDAGLEICRDIASKGLNPSCAIAAMVDECEAAK